MIAELHDGASTDHTGEMVARKAMESPAQRVVDWMQAKFKMLPQVDCPLTHTFTPGIYTRSIFVPAGTLVISKIFKQEFPFVVAQGLVSIWVEGVGVLKVKAPYCGVTLPGTRRIIYHHTDVVFITFHATDKTDVNEIEKDVIFNPEQHDAVEFDEEMVRKLKE
jgi:hypothetical protein